MKNFDFAAVVAIGVTTLAAGFMLRAQRGRPGGPGGAEPFGVEGTWAALAFEVNVSDDTLARLRPHFEAAWREQRAAREAPENFQEFAGRLSKTRVGLNQALKTTLTADESRKLAACTRRTRRPARVVDRSPAGGVWAGRDGEVRHPL